MNKKGFTLVELLAVVGLLGAIMVMAMPKVIDSLNESKKKTFITDAQTIYKTAVMQTEADNINKRTSVTYCRYNGEECCKTMVGDKCKEYFPMLDLQGAKSSDYIITIDKDSVATYYAITNGKYQIIDGVTYSIGYDYTTKNEVTSVTKMSEGISDIEEINMDMLEDLTEYSDSNKINIATISANYDDYTKVPTVGSNPSNIYYLDVNSIVDGVRGCTTTNAFRVNVYINGEKVASNTGDYYSKNIYGTKYEVEYWGINGYTCEGVESSASPAKGIITGVRSVYIVCNKAK